MSKIFLRADGSSTIGLGHIYRLLALSEMLNERFTFVFLTRTREDKITKLISQFCQVHILQQSIDNESEIEEISKIEDRGSGLVIDGYHFDWMYQKRIRQQFEFLVVIDDLCSNPYDADLIINHGKSGIENQYTVTAQTKVLAGPRYAILRRDFLQVALLPRSIAVVENIFICFGGSDPYELTVRAINAALKVNFIKKIIVVTGAGFNANSEFYQLTSNHSNLILHRTNVDALTMVQLMQQCEIAISTASTIAFELCCVKLGLLIGLVEPNQQSIFNELVDGSCAIGLNDLKSASINQIADAIRSLGNVDTVRDQIAKQNTLFDGLSARRISLIFEELNNTAPQQQF